MGWFKDNKDKLRPKREGRVHVTMRFGKPVFAWRPEKSLKTLKDFNKPVEKQKEINAAVADIDPELNDTLDDLWQGTDSEKKLFELMKRDGKKKL